MKITALEEERPRKIKLKIFNDKVKYFLLEMMWKYKRKATLIEGDNYITHSYLH